jgi:2-phospho-L-lactate guanylyltransferase
MPDVGAPGQSWAIVIPVKRLDRAKTRLGVAAPVRRRLAMAMALDTLGATLRCGAVGTVIVVTDETDVADAARERGALVVADEPDDGLNAALRHGGASAPEGAGVAAVAADLPALRPDELSSLLEAAATYPLSVVADAAGSGTTLYAAASVARFDPRFGAGSLAAHVAAGAVDLTQLAGASVRTDVDTLDDLRAAERLGVGTATASAMLGLDRHVG